MGCSLGDQAQGGLDGRWHSVEGMWAWLEQTDGTFLTTEKVTRKGTVSVRSGDQVDSVRERALRNSLHPGVGRGS